MFSFLVCVMLNSHILSHVVWFIFYNCIINLFVVSKPSLWTIHEKNPKPYSNICCFNTYKDNIMWCGNYQKINLFSLRLCVCPCCVCICTICVMYCVKLKKNKKKTLPCWYWRSLMCIVEERSHLTDPRRNTFFFTYIFGNPESV